MELAVIRPASRLEPATPLETLCDRAWTLAQSYKDHPDVPLGRTRVRLDGTWMFEGETGVFSRHALSQLCARVPLADGGALPAGYLARCPSPLAAENLNHWLSRLNGADQRVLVRTLNGVSRKTPEVRAVLSDRYATVDNLQLLQALRDLAPEHGLRVQGWSLDAQQLTLRLVADGDHPVSLKDPLRVGVQVSNSEVGLGRISVTALIHRLVCTNGLVVKVADLGGIHRRHIGRAGEDLAETIQAALPRVLEQADQAIRRFTRLREIPAPEPLQEFLKKTAREADLPEASLAHLTAVLEGETLYDVVNAVTQVAQRYPLAERVRLETHIAGQFLKGDPSRN